MQLPNFIGRGKEGVRVIGKTFASSKSLTHLDLSRNNDIGDKGIICLANAAKESAENEIAFPSLEKLILSECNIGPAGVESLAGIILGPNSNIRRLKPIHLKLSSNPIGSEGCSELARLCAIPNKGSLISDLQISQCSIGDEGIQLLANAATSNACVGLTALDLSENIITKEGVSVFAKSLVNSSWPDLVDLKLARNDLGCEGVTSVMAALITRGDRSNNEESAQKKNSTLQNLDLSCTNCTIEGAKAALMSGSLKSIRLFNNRLGSDGFHSISSLLQGGHPAINTLDLGGNDADEEAVVALLNSIADKRNDVHVDESKLSVLEIGGNKFGAKAVEALKELKQVWPLLDVAHDKPVQE